MAAIDLNMGCPKEFSVQGGMGAALLKKPELVKEVNEVLLLFFFLCLKSTLKQLFF